MRNIYQDYKSKLDKATEQDLTGKAWENIFAVTGSMDAHFEHYKTVSLYFIQQCTNNIYVSDQSQITEQTSRRAGGYEQEGLRSGAGWLQY